MHCAPSKRAASARNPARLSRSPLFVFQGEFSPPPVNDFGCINRAIVTDPNLMRIAAAVGHLRNERFGKFRPADGVGVAGKDRYRLHEASLRRCRRTDLISLRFQNLELPQPSKGNFSDHYLLRNRYSM